MKYANIARAASMNKVRNARNTKAMPLQVAPFKDLASYKLWKQ